LTQPITLKFTDGRKNDSFLIGTFNPGEDRIDVILSEKENKRTTIELKDLCCVMMKGKTEIPRELKHEEIEEVETLDGERYQVFIPKNNVHKRGFLGVPVKKSSPYNLIFFTIGGVRARRRDRSLGEILKESGYVSDAEIDKVLIEQKRLRNLRIGEIIAENNRLSQETVDNAIQSVMKKNIHGKQVRVGELLISAGLVTREQVQRALESQEAGKKKRIGTLLIENGDITEEQLLMALAAKFRMKFVNLMDIVPSQAALNVLSLAMIDRLQVMPLEADDKSIVVATSDPTDHTISEILRFNTNRKVELVAATSDQITSATEKYFHRVEESMDELLEGMNQGHIDIEEDLEDSQINESDSQVIKFVNGILINAYQNRASDIHLEPRSGARGTLQVRYRIDGDCRIEHQIPSAFKRAVISRIKIMANLDIAERRKPQSGKIVLRMDRKKIEYRLETTPTVGDQEDAVLRILSSSRPFTLNEMGFSNKNLTKFRDIITKPYGIILCVGPTGSGKTTSLHSALHHLNKPDRKIWTAEDPVEITQEGLRQVQVNPKIGFSFQEALRSFLRADPDIIMIGEMRDEETAKIAIEASLTGHLVLSTLHTNSAPETVVRLIEMGMDPYNFADALLGVLAQRLTRKLCNHCKESYHPEKQVYDELVSAYGEENYANDELKTYSENFFLMKRMGCKTCDKTGYLGRMAIHELLTATEPIKVAIKQGKSMEKIRTIAIEDGMRTLRMDGIHKVIEGHTDIDQVYRVCV